MAGLGGSGAALPDNCPQIVDVAGPDLGRTAGDSVVSAGAEPGRFRAVGGARTSRGIVHGKMTPADKEMSMKLFKDGVAHILIATTVIEVGVDIPNATVMVIESAERFGLSQLHQLRGRVGRGADQSYCILMSSDKLSREAAKRIEVMIRTNDGFEIAETDLQLRGPGDIEGTLQSGIPFDLKIADLGKDGQLIEYVRHIAEEILNLDPLLENTQNLIFRSELKRLFSQKQSWSNIS